MQSISFYALMEWWPFEPRLILHRNRRKGREEGTGAGRLVALVDGVACLLICTVRTAVQMDMFHTTVTLFYPFLRKLALRLASFLSALYK